MANEWSQAAATELRAQAGRERVTSRYLSEATGLSTASIARKLKGERQISLDEFANLSVALNVATPDMFNRVAAAMKRAA